MRAGKIALVVIGVLVALLSFALVVGGITLLWAYGTQRDADGFFATRTYDFATEWHAVTTEDLRFGAEPGDWWPSGNVATLKLEVTGDQPVFVGIGASSAVDDYIADVGRAVVDDVNPFNDTPDLEVIPGPAPASPPVDQDFWVVSAAGDGTQTITWDIEAGDWTAVLMNADGSGDISADVVAGAKVGFILGIAIGMLVVGVLFGVAAAVLLVAGLRRETPPGAEPPPSEREPDIAAGSGTGVDAEGRPITHTDQPAGLTAPVAAAGAGSDGGGTYPARLEGWLEPGLSRWMWLVKWFLAIPHFIVVAFLAIAFLVMTIVAGLSILFTTRYPRGIFDFNVGVIRWAWRVSFYCSSPLASDRYPPFTLAPGDYPATFEVEYPTQLNRWLPLVKWLLAIPHLIIVGVFTSGAVWLTRDIGGPGSDAVLEVGGGLVQILTFVAVIALLFTGKYPQGIFDLVMAMERWAYRTVAYVGLMTDDYPPFRFDMGGREGATEPVGPDPAAQLAGGR